MEGTAGATLFSDLGMRRRFVVPYRRKNFGCRSSDILLFFAVQSKEKKFMEQL